jgi:hypothetical protein
MEPVTFGVPPRVSDRESRSRLLARALRNGQQQPGNDPPYGSARDR